MYQQSSNYRRTKYGLIQKIYKKQVEKSKERNHGLPEYTLHELREWMLSQDIYHKLHAEWVESEYDTQKIPSCDRLDDYKGYSFDNLRIVTWRENQQKEYDDRKNGLNNKLNNPVSQYSKNGELIRHFHSHQEAQRVTGVEATLISRCRRGLQKHAGKFLWRETPSEIYATPQENQI